MIHTDVCGPMQVNSLGGSRYYLLFKDDYSHFRFVYFIKEKSEVAEKLKSFVNFVEKQTSHKIRIIRSDNGTEYINANVAKFLDERGIKHECTVPHTPEQNGSSERENRTIMEAARTMIYSCDSEKPKEFLWAEAINTAVNVINRSGTSSIKDKTPFELWFNKSAIFDNLKVFGGTVYAHIPKQKRRKLDKKSSKCVFVGYSEHSNVYRVYNPEKRTVEVVRDIVFAKESNSHSETANEKNDSQNQRDIVVLDSVSAEKKSNVTETIEENENQMNPNESVVSIPNESVVSIPNETVVSIESSDDDEEFYSNDGENSSDADTDNNNFVQRRSGSRICNVDS